MKRYFPHHHVVYVIRTLCCVATGSVLYEDVVERLVGPIG